MTHQIKEWKPKKAGGGEGDLKKGSEEVRLNNESGKGYLTHFYLYCIA